MNSKSKRIRKTFFGAMALNVNADDLLDTDEEAVLLHEQHFTFLDKITFAFHYKRMIAVLPEGDVRERLISEWMTISVVSAFVASFAFTNIGNGTPAFIKNHPSSWWVAKVYTICTVTSYCMATCSLLLCLVYFMALNAIPVRHTKGLARTMARVLPAPAATMLFAFGAIHIVVAVTAIAEYPEVTMSVAFTQALILIVFGTACCIWLFFKVRAALHKLYAGRFDGARQRRIATIEAVLRATGLPDDQAEACIGAFAQQGITLEFLRQLLGAGAGASRLLQGVLEEVLPDFSAVQRARIMLAVKNTV